MLGVSGGRGGVIRDPRPDAQVTVKPGKHPCLYAF